MSRPKCRWCGGARPDQTNPKDEPLRTNIPTWPSRPPAPEAQAAAAAAKVSALAEATKKLREAGLYREANALEKPLPKLVKASTKEPKPGARLDGCKDFVDRANKRVIASSTAITAAEQALQAAREHHVQLERELAEGKERYAELQREVQSFQGLPGDNEVPILTTTAENMKELIETYGGHHRGRLPAEVEQAMVVFHSYLDTQSTERHNDDDIDFDDSDDNDGLGTNHRPNEPSTERAASQAQHPQASNAIRQLQALEDVDAMEDLDEADDGDEQALVAIARRLKRARQR